MSSMRNAAPRRPHRERSQPQARAKWGLLEKHKDYSLRAADYNAKQAKLSVLKQKSRDKHPDEFAFGMVHGKAGKSGSRGDENRLSHRVVEGLKNQDGGYLRVADGKNRRELERTTQQVALSQAMRVQDFDKVVFGEDGQPLTKRRRLSGSDHPSESESRDGSETVLEELDQNSAQPAGGLSTAEIAHEDEDSEDTATNKPQQKILTKKVLQRQKNHLAQLKANRRRRKRLQEARAVKLDILRKRQKEIMAAADALDLQRAKMAKVVGGVNKNGIKFKVRERKK